MASEVSIAGADLPRGVADLERELNEAHQREAATAEVLKVISGSRFDLQSVFDMLVRNALKLCEAERAFIFRFDGRVLRAVASQNVSPEMMEFVRRNPVAPGSHSASARAAHELRTIHIEDIQAEPGYTYGVMHVDPIRTVLAIPLLKAHELLGVIVVYRHEVRQFTVRQIALLETFANQAVIAIENLRLFEEMQAKTRDLTESLEYQTATSDVLSTVARSPSEPQRVLDLIIETAMRLCQAESGNIWKIDDGEAHAIAAHGFDAGFVTYQCSHTIRPGRGNLIGRIMIERRIVHIEDVLADPEYTNAERQKVGRFRTVLGVPMLRDDKLIGVIALAQSSVRPFTDRQIDLLKTFADQAVIAIENTRLFEAEQASKRELQESLEYQTATAEVLSVISRSPNALQPVLDSIVETAQRLCQSDRAQFFKLENGKYHLASQQGTNPDFLTYLVDNPISVDPQSGSATNTAVRPATSTAVRERRTVHVPDVLADPGLAGAAHLGRARSVLAVPLVRNRVVIGVVIVAQDTVRPFTGRQIELIETFASQALIAIENTRLFEAEQASKRELTEALEQQTATADVLKVISRSALDVQKVLDALVESAARLTDANDAAIFQVFGDTLRLVAHHGQIPMVGPVGQLTLPLVRGAIGGRAVIDRRTIQVADMLAEADEYPESKKRALQRGFRTALAVPLVHAGEAIGVILIRRNEVCPFAERQIELVNTFADQAVIAIENTRLFEEVQAQTRNLSIALQRQTATSEILGIISASPGQLEPVFNAILERARELCAAKFGHLLLLDGQAWRAAALHNVPPAYADFWRSASPAALRVTLLSRLLETKQPYQVEDLRLSKAYRMRVPLTVATVELAGARTLLGVPLVKDDLVIGAIVLYRTDVHPFDERQIALLSSFTDQAVIAIENTRLFEEVRARTRELAKTVEDLEIASQHKNQFVANMSHELRTPLAAILGYAELMQEGFYEQLGQKSLDALTRIRSNGKHLLGLINTVLDVAKIESGQFTLNMGEYAIESVVETVRAATESLAQNKKLTLTTSVDKSLPIGLGDEQRLTQVLLNLVGNAIKFTDAGEVSIAAGARNGHFAVSVTDTGPGIPLDQQDRIFDQFHQVDSSNTKAKGGTGLGLAIAKQIVEMHGGRIWVESTVGNGSTFQMEIPTRAEFRKLAL
jgi:GAF domain-containing protein